MLLESERTAIAEQCERFGADGLIVGTAGNISIRVDDLVAITASGVDYSRMRPEYVTVMDMSGKVVDGDLAPSSEWALHLAAYEATGAHSVVHTHSPKATAVASLEGVTQIPGVHYYVCVFGGPLPIAKYARYGTPELAENVRESLKERTACLMANHGAVVTGKDLASTYDKARQLEWLAEVYLHTLSAGTPRILSDEALDEVSRAIVHYGQAVPPKN